MRNINDIKKIVDMSMDLTMDAIKFVELEVLCRLAECIGMMDNADKLYMLLSRSDVIYENNFSNDNYLIANAKILLKTMSHAKVYKDALTEYRMQSNQKYAMYSIDGKSLIKNPIVPLVYENRLADYDALLNGIQIDPMRNKAEAKFGDAYLVRCTSGTEARIKFEPLEIQADRYTVKHRKSGAMKVSMEDILKAADKLDAIEGTKYRRRVLTDNIYEVSTGVKVKATECIIDGVVNMAGQVAAGKSTFADAISVSLMEKGYRIVMILDTVDAILKKAEIIKKLEFEVCTLIGNYGRSRHIDQQMHGMNYLPEFVSDTLQQPCMLNALIKESSEVIKYGQEPCLSIKQVNDYESKKTYVCPYYDICPKTLQDRKIKSADLVITTPDGFCYCMFGKEKENFLQYAIANFDLVIMDEVDSVVCSLDNIFAPSLAVNQYLTKNIPYRFSFKNGELNSKSKWDKKEQKFISKLDDFDSLMTVIHTEIKEERTGWWKSDLKSFSAMSLLYKLSPDTKGTGIIPQIIWDAFYGLLKPQSIKAGNIREVELMQMAETGEISIPYMIEKISEIIAEGTKDTPKGIDLKRKEVKNAFEALETGVLKRLFFLIKVIAFEQLYRELSDLVEGMSDVSMELREILNRNLYKQQRFMPNAPVGNTLAIEVRDNEMYIKKQFALGRALALRMPYLVLDQNGNPIGANVLLMSGTGYMPGSDRYNIGNKVDYVIEAEQAKRDYISNTKIKSMRSEICVSGTKQEDKNKNLRLLIEQNEEKIMKCLKRNERILMIVNSYEQCKVAYATMEKILSKQESECTVRYLATENGEMIGNNPDNMLYRRDITSFCQEILIAPACVIGRGHNIVDIFGNAWFDTVMFLVRPMTDPNDYNVHVQKVNGYIMNHYTGYDYQNRMDVMEKIKKDAFGRYAKLHDTKGGLSDLPDDMRTDAIASLFVVIEQVFGRLCRVGSNIKEKYPTIYWVDGAFHAKTEGGFDTLKELEKYLEYLMERSYNPLVAKTLYGPFYEALKGEKIDE